MCLFFFMTTQLEKMHIIETVTQKTLATFGHPVFRNGVAGESWRSGSSVEEKAEDFGTEISTFMICRSQPQLLHVWNIYQHLPHKWPKCR